MNHDVRLSHALNPRSIAVVGASENPEKIGGRPIKYMLRQGYSGAIFPINPTRATVQGLPAYPTLDTLPETPDMAIVAVPGALACSAVEQAAAAGIRTCVVMSSGFAETDDDGKRAQADMVSIARGSGMRIIGPNTQGLANFSTGAVASFATLISEIPPQDGPVAIISQSGAMSMVPYAALREMGIGIRYSIATGNECDLTVAELAMATLQDPDIRILLLYAEHIPDPERWARMAELARQRGVPVLALKAGVSAAGQAAASSHTGALASDDRVTDAFFQKHGICRVHDMRAMVNAVPLYLRGRLPTGNRLIAISNSGASCVMAADAAERHGLSLDPFEHKDREAVSGVLPSFASAANPIDLTAALLTDSSLFTNLLPLLSQRNLGDLFLITLPMSGIGYDVPGFARDAAAFARASNKPVAVAAPLASTRQTFFEHGLPVFSHDIDAIAALGQLSRHAQLLRNVEEAALSRTPTPRPREHDARPTRFMSEADSLDLLETAGIACIPHRVCTDETQAVAAWRHFGRPVVLKACSDEIPHKSDHGLVVLDCNDEASVRDTYRRLAARAAGMGKHIAGILIAPMIRGRYEFVLGGRYDERFGAIVMLGEGGKYVEALPDFTTLIHPFSMEQAERGLRNLRMAPLLKGVRGEAAVDTRALCRSAVALAECLHRAAGKLRSVDMNPVVVGVDDSLIDGDTVVLDALVEYTEAYSTDQ